MAHRLWIPCCHQPNLIRHKFVKPDLIRGTFFKVGGVTSARQKNYRKFLWYELATVTSQALKYDVITCTPYEGINYTILDKMKPLRKRINEPTEIRIACYQRWATATLKVGLLQLSLFAENYSGATPSATEQK